jgi:crossover junction endodeoxyribonuclease RusA
VTLAFTVYGVAQSKGNMRAIALKGMKFPIVTDSNRSAKSWQQLVAAGASLALNALPAPERELLAYGVRLSIAFYLPRPKKHAKRGVFVPHCVAPDIDKLERAVLDALTQVVYRDDRQVTEVIKGKYYAAVDEPARVEIRVEPAPGQPLVAQPATRPLFELLAVTS